MILYFSHIGIEFNPWDFKRLFVFLFRDYERFDRDCCKLVISRARASTHYTGGHFASTFCGGWIKLNRACKSAGREPLIIDIAFPR